MLSEAPSGTYSPNAEAMTVLARKIEALKIHARWRWRAMRRHIRRERLRRQIEETEGPLAFRFDSPGNGLFAHLTWCLHVAGWAAREGREFEVSCTSANYGNASGNTDWLAQIIEHQHPCGSKRVVKTFLVREFEELPFYNEASVFSLDEARGLFRRTFRPACSVGQRVEQLKARLFQGRFVVGLHYRGTDKQLEAERITHEDALHSAREALTAAKTATGSFPALFLATDEAAMVEFAPRFLHPYPVTYVESAVRSTNGQPIHQGSGSFPSDLATQAMTDALLLGECDVLLKTASMLSGWSTVMSSPKPVIMLNRPRPGSMFFPDYLVAEVALQPGEEREAITRAVRGQTEITLGGAFSPNLPGREL